MGNEYDTFDILRRTPITMLFREYHDRIFEFVGNPPLFYAWLEKHGWDHSSFNDAERKYSCRRK